MNLPLRHSITEVVRVWDTNINPVQVIADDVKDYVAKHNRGQAPCTRLRNEVLAHAYAGIWGLPVLEAALLKVDPLHVGRHLSGTCQPAYFKHTCFATRFRKDSTEFNRFLDQANAYEGKRFVNRQDLFFLPQGLRLGTLRWRKAHEPKGQLRPCSAGSHGDAWHQWGWSPAGGESLFFLPQGLRLGTLRWRKST